MEKKIDYKVLLKQIIKYFLQGLLITAPIAITSYVLYQLFTGIQG